MQSGTGLWVPDTTASAQHVIALNVYFNLAARKCMYLRFIDNRAICGDSFVLVGSFRFFLRRFFRIILWWNFPGELQLKKSPKSEVAEVGVCEWQHMPSYPQSAHVRYLTERLFHIWVWYWRIFQGDGNTKIGSLSPPPVICLWFHREIGALT